MKKLTIIILLLLLQSFQINAEEVSILVNGYKIAGTLEVPETDTPVSVALIIAGSGPTDRDGNNPLAGKNNSLKMIAELLYKNNIASLRFDKRGIGANNKVNQSGLTFDLYINDIAEWVKYLKNDKRFSNVFIIGHSEGSLLGIMAAKQVEVKKLVSVCGISVPAFTLIAEQIKNQGAPAELINKCIAIMDSLKEGHTVSNIDPSLTSIFHPSIQPYMISWFKYNPAKEISDLTIPVLVIGGTTDIQVGIEQAEGLSKAAKNSTLKIIENMNHILKDVKTIERMSNLQSYNNPDLPLSIDFSTKLIEFLKE